MKTFIILACFLVAANALSKEFVDQFITKVKAIGEKCVQETHASDADVADLKARRVPDSHEGKCAIFCIYKSFNMQNADGSVNLEGAIQSIEPLKADDPEYHSKVLKMFETCTSKAVIDADPCITAAGLTECGKSESKNLGVPVEMFQF